MSAGSSICRRCLKSFRCPPRTQFLRRASTVANSSLPPILLQRARKLAAEHDHLSASLATDFDSKSAKRVGEISSVASALREWEEARSSISELTGMLSEYKDEELQQLAQDELESANAQLDQLALNLTTSLVPKDAFSAMPCLLEFRPGPGGLEGRFFADSLFHMYKNYCIRKGYRARVVSYELSDNAGLATGFNGERGLQEAVLEVQDENSYERFRGEGGMHRVQRIPTTEKSGRVHTSVVAVWVLPSFPEARDESSADFNDPESDFYVNPADVHSETMRSGGAGGQHVNKTESAIRLTHIPTGIVVKVQESRSQHQNRELAWRVLRSRLAQQRREKREEEARKLRSNLAGAQINRSEKIRTYNYNQDRCTDHRSGLDVHNLPDVLEGGQGLDKLIGSVREWLTSKDVQVLIADEEAAAKSAETKK